MDIVIIIFGLLMQLIGVLLVINPEIIFKVLRNSSQQLWLHISAVGVRLLLGVLLIYQADDSKLPLTMTIIGWIAVIAALVFTVMGRKNFQNLVLWAFSLMNGYGRIAGIFALFFGAGLIYAFV